MLIYLKDFYFNSIQDKIPVFSIKYGTGKITGEFVKDKVNICGISIDQQIFGLTYREDGYAFNNVKALTFKFYLL